MAFQVLHHDAGTSDLDAFDIVVLVVEQCGPGT